MKRYIFMIILAIFVIGTGIAVMARDSIIAKQAETVKWKHVSGDKVYAENVVVELSTIEGDQEIGYRLSTDGIEKFSIKDMFTKINKLPVEKFYKENEAVFQPYAPLFRNQPKDEQLGEKYYWDGTTLAYATVKTNEPLSDYVYLQLKVVNTKSGKVKEVETTLGDAAVYDIPKVSDVQVIDDTLYVMVFNTNENDRNWIYIPYIFSFDVNTLERKEYKTIIEPDYKTGWAYYSFIDGSDIEPSNYHYFYGYNKDQSDGSETPYDPYKLLVWDYKKGTVTDLSNKLKKTMNGEFPSFYFLGSFSVKDSLYMLNRTKQDLSVEDNSMELIQVHSTEIQKIELENSTFGAYYEKLPPLVRNGYLYLVAIQDSKEEPKEGLLVYEIETGKLVYEGHFSDRTKVSANNLHFKE